MKGFEALREHAGIEQQPAGAGLDEDAGVAEVGELHD
jgi:hypothetical protein